MKWVVAAAAAAAVLGVGAAWSHGPGGESGGFGGYGMGSGMMGPGMMGPGMMGQGMMGPGMMWGLDLSAEQREKIAAIRKEVMGSQWDAMSKLHERGGPMHQAYASGEFNEEAARKAYDAMAQAHRQMFESNLEARIRIDSLLTEEQRKKLRGAQ